MTETAAPPATPFEALGGRETIERFVERFYDLMDSEAEFAELRAMHAPDLAPMRQSLAGFITGWAGGPRDWFEQNPGKCMMSAHKDIAATKVTVIQWINCMTRAVSDCGMEDDDLAQEMLERFTMMARPMAKD